VQCHQISAFHAGLKNKQKNKQPWPEKSLSKKNYSILFISVWS
jgi:hypothetical protein